MVRFNVVGEFLTELAKDVAVIDRRIVRVTALYVTSNMTPVIRHLSVVATYKAAGEVVRFESYVGDVWGNTEQDQKYLKKAEELMDHIAQHCNQHGLEVRAGIYE